MKLSILHEFTAGSTSSDRINAYMMAIIEYLEKYKKEGLNIDWVDFLDVVTITQEHVNETERYPYTEIIVSENGKVQLQHYTLSWEKTLEWESLYDPDSFPKILEFVNRFDYEA